MAARKARSEGRMPLRQHFLELRRRLALAALGVLLGGIGGWFLYEPVIAAMTAPLLELEDRGLVAPNFTGIASAFDMQVKVSVFLGVLISSPWWIYQLWAFITPGLTSKERRYAVGFLAAAIPLFLAGAFLAWRVLPHAVELLLEFTPPDFTNLVDAQLHLSFVMQVVLVFGIAFLMPVVMVALNLVGLVRARTWLAGWRWAVLIVFTFAAFATPTPDAITMIILALPMCGLYFAAVGLCALHDRRVARRAGALDAGLGGADSTLA